MALRRASRARLVWALELSLGLELYACAVLALHARGLRATPLEASLALVLPALVIPPVFYVLVALVGVRPLALVPVIGAAAAMCGLHGLLVVATGALFMIPDLLDYRAAVAFALWGSPAVTLLQLTAAPLVFARLRPLVSAPRAPRAEARAVSTHRRVEAPAITGTSRQVVSAAAPPASAPHAIAPSSAARHQEHAVAPPAQLRPPTAPPAIPAPAFVSPLQSGAGHSAPSAASAGPAVASSPPAPAVRRSVALPAGAANQAPVVSVSAKSTPSAPAEPRSGETPPRRVLDWAEPMIRVPFVRIADQLPVEMFARGPEGLKDTLRPGVSLLVPRKLLLPHLGEGLAPVKWEEVADQFPLDELVLTHEEIADRLPDGSLLLPLDEVVPQIPPALLALSTPPVDVHEIEEFPAPFQPHSPELEPVVSEAAEATTTDVADREEAAERAVAEADGSDEDDEAEGTLQPVAAAADEALHPELALEEPEIFAAPAHSATSEVRVELERPTYRAPAPPASETDSAAEPMRSDQARRIAALLTPLLNGLEIGQRDGAGTTLVTVVAPTLSEDSVVRTAVRLVPFLSDARLPEPVTQATLTAADATVVLTPFGPRDTGGALLVTAVASRAALAWLERLSRTAAREARVETANGKHAGPGHDSGAGIELSAASVPAAVRELAGSLTAFGPVAPTLLRDRAGALSACLFLPSSVDALPLAQYARDLHAALEGAELGGVASVILKLGTLRVVLRAMAGAGGRVTMLVGVGRIERPGLARIELDRAATRLGALVRG
jgi:hypothetical protein